MLVASHIIYLINEESDFDKYSFERRAFKERLTNREMENYWDCAHDYVKIVYRNIEVVLVDSCIPHDSRMIDFSLNNKVESVDWGPSECYYEIPFYSRISNPHFKYLLDFIDYCSYWRIVEEYSERTMYKQIRNLIPSFVKEYKKIV